jgi:monofunctional biosynthetic peptidoglycan transglycosylase
MVNAMTFRLLRKIKAVSWLAVSCRVLRWGLRLLPILILMDVGYLVGIWPDWNAYAEGPAPRSQFILAYELEQSRHESWRKLRWRPVSMNNIPRGMVRAVIVAEDARFYSHNGVDIDALRAAMEHNLSEKKLLLGGSTISQQTVKNLFLKSSRNPLRKWHELVLTLGMEHAISKKRILEIYLNVAEFGRGIYGVDAAARFYWGISASRMSDQQCIELAATLPSPVRNNPGTRTRSFNNRIRKIRRYF